MKQELQNANEAITITLSLEEKEAFLDLVNTVTANQVSLSLEEVAQRLLNCIEDMPTDIGHHYFAIRQVKDFYVKAEPIFKRLCQY